MTLDYSTPFTELANIAVVASLLLVAYQIWRQRQDIRFSANEGLMSDFSRMTLFLVDHPRIARQIYPSNTSKSKRGNKSRDKEMAINYLDSLLGLFQRAWMASNQSEARREDWIGWRNWLKSLSKSPLIADLLEASEGEWEQSFRDELDAILKETQAEKSK